MKRVGEGDFLAPFPSLFHLSPISFLPTAPYYLSAWKFPRRVTLSTESQP